MHARATLPPALVALAADQDQCFTTAQATAAGLARTALQRCALGAWRSGGDGVWLCIDEDGSPLTARRRARLVQLVRGDAVACDELGCELLGYDGWWGGSAARHLVAIGRSRRAGARRAGLREPDRQVDIYTADGVFVARVDVAWFELGVIVEADGSQHDDQRLHDEERDLAIFQATGCMVVHLRWRHVVTSPRAALRRLQGIAAARSAP